MSSTTLAPSALNGFSASIAYDTHRPSYPPHVVDFLLEQAELKGRKGARIIDLGAGTGKFTELLAQREEGFVIRAEEPHPDMRRVLEEKALRGVEVFPWGAEERVEGWEGWAEGVVVAQAYHWFSTPSALRAIHTHLLPSHFLSIIWNIEDYNQHPAYPCATAWESQLRDLLWSMQDGAPRYRDALWQKSLQETELFERPYGERVFEQKVKVEGGKEGLWRRIGTLSYVRKVEKEGGERWREVRRRFEEIVEGRGREVPEEREEGEEGEVVIHLITHVVWTRRVD